MTFDRINMDAFEQELVELRRDFHRYAESGWTEFRTTARIITELEKLDLPVKYGPEIHVKEKMYGLPKPEVLNACWQRALGETDHPELVRAMEGGYTGCITEIDGALPGPTVGIRVDIDCNDVVESTSPAHVPTAEGFRYGYEAQGIGMIGESCVVKRGKTLFYLHFYTREALKSGGLQTWEAILASASDTETSSSFCSAS